jgi:hypothetical protein
VLQWRVHPHVVPDDGAQRERETTIDRSAHKGGLVMKSLPKRVGVLWMSLMMVAFPAMAADAPKVINVLAIKVKGDQTAYLQRVKQLSEIQKRLETGGTMRVWRATLAGQNTDTIYVTVEFPNLEAFAKSMAKTQADEEWNKVMKELDTSGLRKVLSRSQLVEITP